MASNVWLQFKSDKPKAPGAEYVRGDEIIEVFWRGSSSFSYGEEKTTWSVSVTKARIVDAEGGTCPETVRLWEVPDEPAAAGAALALLAALSGSAAGVVVLGEDHRVRVVPFDELAGRP